MRMSVLRIWVMFTAHNKFDYAYRLFIYLVIANSLGYIFTVCSWVVWGDFVIVCGTLNQLLYTLILVDDDSVD